MRLEGLPQASYRLLGMFVEARLLVTGKGIDGDAVEIAHEALLRNWPLLGAGWMKTRIICDGGIDWKVP